MFQENKILHSNNKSLKEMLGNLHYIKQLENERKELVGSFLVTKFIFIPNFIKNNLILLFQQRKNRSTPNQSGRFN